MAKASPSASAADRLFIGIYPCGIVYADRHRERGGDYARVAFLSYRTLQLDVEPGAHQLLVAAAREHAATIQARRGKPFEISACHQTVILGEG